MKVKVNLMSNLWVGYNDVEDIRVLVCALDKDAALESISERYLDEGLKGEFEITPFENMDTEFTLDYAL